MLGDLRIELTIVLFVGAMIICAGIGVRRWVGILLLVLLSLVWLTVDKLWEGPHLVPLGRGHSLVAADLVGLAGLLAAIALTVWRFAHTRAGRRAQ